jgi:hypothetical protein
LEEILFNIHIDKKTRRFKNKCFSGWTENVW